MPKGLGGPGAGHINGLMNYPGMRDVFALNRAAGIGMGAYGYPLTHGIMPWGQQAQMLHNQWPPQLWPEVGENGSGHRLPDWFTFR